MYTFFLTIKKDHSELQLKRGEGLMGIKTWQESRDMGRQLFTAIADILKEYGLKAGEIADFEIRTDVSDNFTSVKIAQTVAAVYNWSVRVLSSKN